MHNAPLESLPGVDTEYGSLDTPDGARLRTLVTRPAGNTGSGRLPAVQFLQWLSRDSIEIAPEARDGWSLMLRRLVTESGAVVLRTEKSAGSAEFHIIPGLNHHFEAYVSAEAAFREKGGRPDPDRMMDVLMRWLHDRLR